MCWKLFLEKKKEKKKKKIERERERERERENFENFFQVKKLTKI